MGKVFKFLMVFVVAVLIGRSTIATSSQIFPKFYRKTRSPLGRVIESPMQKCHCGSNQVWNLRCEEARTFVPMLDFDPLTKSVVNTGIFNSIIVSQVKCQEGRLQVPLSVGSFYLLRTGELFHMMTGVKFDVGNYCVEHVRDFAFHTIRLGAVVCVPRPKVPLCCPKGQMLKSQTFTCENYTDVSFSPPIYKEPLFVKWESIEGPHTGLPQCYNNEIYQHFVLERGDQAALLYRENGIFLHWLSYPFDPFYIVGPEEYCVAFEDTGRGFMHTAFICIEPLLLDATVRSSGHKKPPKDKKNFYIFPSVVVG